MLFYEAIAIVEKEFSLDDVVFDAGKLCFEEVGAFFVIVIGHVAEGVFFGGFIMEIVVGVFAAG